MMLRRLMKDLILPVAVAIALAFLIQATVAKPYEIPTGSMEPTILTGDRVIANRVIYKVRDVGRGDIIVFDPTDAARQDCPSSGGANTPFVKRVIGLPGERIELIPGTSEVRIDGVPYVVPAARDNPESGTFTVPEGKIFVLGDNRPESCDSHQWTHDPYVPLGNVIGQAEVTYWPLRHVKFLD